MVIDDRGWCGSSRWAFLPGKSSQMQGITIQIATAIVVLKLAHDTNVIRVIIPGDYFSSATNAGIIKLSLEINTSYEGTFYYPTDNTLYRFFSPLPATLNAADKSVKLGCCMLAKAAVVVAFFTSCNFWKMTPWFWRRQRSCILNSIVNNWITNRDVARLEKQPSFAEVGRWINLLHPFQVPDNWLFLLDEKCWLLVCFCSNLSSGLN